MDKQSLKGTEGKNCVEIAPKGISYLAIDLKREKTKNSKILKKKKAIKCELSDITLFLNQRVTT